MDRHTFLAVPIPLEIQRKMHDYANEVRPQIPLKKWTSLGDFHITLEFLGSTPEKQAHQLIKEMKKISSRAFQLTINTYGFFGNARTPKVFWLGVDQSSELNELHQQVQLCCASAGFNPSTRPYSPHITLGKRWGGGSSGISSDELPKPLELTDLTWQIDEVILFEIHPEREQKYVPLSRFPLSEGKI